MKFSIRDLLLVTVIVALALAWWREHLEVLRTRREVLATERLYGEARDRALAEAETANSSLEATIASYNRVIAAYKTREKTPPQATP